MQPKEYENCSQDQEEYCKLGDNNTICKFCGIDFEACFDTVFETQLNETHQNLIVDFHNKLRSKIANGEINGQPKASNMKKLKWNEELAKVAQMWANQCPNDHDPNRKSPGFTHEPGQNIADTWTTDSQDKVLEIFATQNCPKFIIFSRIGKSKKIFKLGSMSIKISPGKMWKILVQIQTDQ